MGVTIKDIARELNLSTTAVSLVLNDRLSKSYISEPTQKRILDKAKELGYTPNRIARALVSGRTYTVRFWMFNPEQPYYSKVFHHMRLQSDEHGYTLQYNSYANANSKQMPVDAIIAVDVCERLQTLFDTNSGSTSIISIGAFYSEDFDYVGVDLRAGAVEAVEHLVTSGCRRIAFAVPRAATNLFDGECRYDGYSAVMKSAGYEPEIINIEQHSRACARQTMADYIHSKGCPDGIFCYNDDIAIGALRGLCDLGIRVPDDVALIGCDGIEDCEYHNPSISTIVHPVEEMCTLAWQYLLNRIEDPSRPLQQIVLKPTFVIRESSRT